ncbi:MAG: PEP-CTERM sorting domain-containing protein [Pirellulales bacterium]
MGDNFTIVTVGIRTGEFDTIVGNPGTGLKYESQYFTDQVLIEIIATLPGDFNLDGDVDGHVFLKWQRGESPLPLSTADRSDWEANFGAIAPISVFSIAVPEPSTTFLLMLGMAATIYFRYKTQSIERS